jgi:hypothetical protein
MVLVTWIGENLIIIKIIVYNIANLKLFYIFTKWKG